MEIHLYYWFPLKIEIYLFLPYLPYIIIKLMNTTLKLVSIPLKIKSTTNIKVVSLTKPIINGIARLTTYQYFQAIFAKIRQTRMYTKLLYSSTYKIQNHSISIINSNSTNNIIVTAKSIPIHNIRSLPKVYQPAIIKYIVINT